MRSLSSSVVICNISMRWRNCGVSTSRWERLVVNLRDILQIRLPILLRLFGFCGLWPHGRIITDQRSEWQILCHKQAEEYTKLLTITCETFRPGKACALPSLLSVRVGVRSERFCPPPLCMRG